MAQAKYTLFIPTSDDQGSPLRQLAEHAHRHLMEVLPRAVIHIEPARQMSHGRQPESHEAIVIHAEDTPITDTRIKQVGAQIAEVANRWGIVGVKEGKQGVRTWEISNPHHQPGHPAEHLALEPQTAAPVAPMHGLG